MTHLAPHRTHFRAAKNRPSWRRAALLAGICFLIAPAAEGQTIVGGNRAPPVSVDLTVLDQLGTAPNLPQLFGASRRPPPAADQIQSAAPEVALQPATKSVTRTHVATQHPARAKSTKSTRLAQAPAPQRSANAADPSVRLNPPTTPSLGGPRVAQGQSALAPPMQSASVAVGSPVPAPAPMPKLPQNDPAPAPPVLPPTPAHDDTPQASQPPPMQAQNDNAPVPLTASPAPRQSASDSSAASVATNGASGARPTQVQVASAASAGTIANSVKFATGATDLPSGSQAMLDGVAAKLMADDALRVQLVAHATGSADQAMEARRVSLARAVAVRAYLIDKGVRSLRMDVRALGNRSDDGPASDQVDLLIISQ